MDESAHSDPTPSAIHDVLLIVGTLTVNSILWMVALVVLSSIFPPSSGAGDVAPNSILSITPRTFAITPADLNAITRSIPDTAMLSRVVSGTAPVGTGIAPPQIRVLGVDPSYAALPEGAVGPGMFFTNQDATAANRVAVLGQTAATSLFPNGESSIGQTIRIRNQPFTVLGVLANRDSTGAEQTDDAILIPFQTSQIRMFGATPIDEVLLTVRDANRTNVVIQQIDDVLRQRHRAPTGQPDGFTVMPARNPMSTSANVIQVLERALQFWRQYVRPPLEQRATYS